MKKYILYIVFLAFSSLYMVSCSEDDDFVSTIYNTDTPHLSDVEKWIRDSFVTPHNIEVIYLWADSESDVTKNMTPARMDTIVPFLRTVKKMWIQPYIELLGLDVLNPILPKQLMLVGSATYNTDGTKTGGTAEKGKKIVMYSLDEFNPRNASNVWEFCHVFHHEFGHILNQQKEYEISFQNLTPKDYTSAWSSVSDADAKAKGFITNYAMAAPGEDFVEVLSIYVTKTQADWDKELEGDKVAKDLIASKLLEVRNYMQKSWGIDIDELRALNLQALNEINKGDY